MNDEFQAQAAVLSTEFDARLAAAQLSQAANDAE
jgi:hypothetical protein